MTKVLTYWSRLSQGLGNQKHQEFKVDKTTRDGKENYFKGTLTQLLYARGDALRSDYKTNKKEVNIVTTFVTKIKR